MTDELDRALRGTFEIAAREAPDVEPGLLERVEAEHRRRRRRRTSAAALTVAVFLGVSGAVGVLSRSGEEPSDVAQAGRLKPVSLSELGTPIKIRQRWPAAVRSLPDELPNGRALKPITLLNGNTLVSATTSFELTDKLWAYDLDTRKATVITDVPVPRGLMTYPSDFTVGQGQIVWWLSYLTGGRETVGVWAAPVTGGKAHKIAEVPGSSLSTLLIDGGNVVWSMKDGLRTVPLSGGSPQKVPGTEASYVISWPWIGSSGSEKLGGVRYKSLRNVLTGERRKAVLAPFKGLWVCAVTWCVGGDASEATSRRDMPMVVQRRDGKGGRSLPPSQEQGAGLMCGRFLPYSPAGLRTKNHLLYDVQTGRLLDTGVPRNGGGSGPGPRPDARDPLIFLTAKDRTTLIDLSAIR